MPASSVELSALQYSCSMSDVTQHYKDPTHNASVVASFSEETMGRNSTDLFWIIKMEDSLVSHRPLPMNRTGLCRTRELQLPVKRKCRLTELQLSFIQNNCTPNGSCDGYLGTFHKEMTL